MVNVPKFILCSVVGTRGSTNLKFVITESQPDKCLKKNYFDEKFEFAWYLILRNTIRPPLFKSIRLVSRAFHHCNLACKDLMILGAFLACSGGRVGWLWARIQIWVPLSSKSLLVKGLSRTLILYLKFLELP